ncbi:MAG: response regulator [Planctomycetes bacterium]|nr:response regulator [Planctomycetota bacterium]
MWLHNSSDLLIWLAYLTIPALLVLFARRRADLPFKGVFWLFGAFLVSCGFAHLVEALTFYHPMYRLSGGMKLATAGLSWAAVLALVPVLPRALAMKGPEELDAINRKLQEEIEERKRTAEALHQKNKELQRSERAKDEFFAGVSHELRTPLTLILAPVESLLGGIHGSLSEAQQRTLEPVHNNAVRLLHMVTGLLDFAKVEAQQVQVRREPSHVALLTRRVVADFRPIAQSKGLELRLSAPDVESPREMDRYLYERILFNLLSNAIKFTPEGSVRVSLEFQGDRIRLAVADTGVGIAESERDALFRRFRQLGSVATRRFEGTGLGLALVQEFAKLLDGSVSVETRAGAGSVLTVECEAPLSAAGAAPDDSEKTRLFLLPRYASVAPPEVRAPAAEELPKVLIAEDNEDLAAYVSDLLKSLCLPRAVRDGQEALRQVYEWFPDIVLADVMMPKLDGLALCREMKSQAGTAHIPVVLLTALTHRQALLKGWEAGADEYLFKPFHPTELVTRIRTLLAGTLQRRRFEEEREQMKAQLRQGQKLQAVGRLAAGVAHEINNPAAYVLSNLHTLGKYCSGLVRLLGETERALERAAAGEPLEPIRRDLRRAREEEDADYALRDLDQALEECREGGRRIQEIVRSLRDFSHADEGVRRPADLHHELDAALRMCAGVLKRKDAAVERDYGAMPPVPCNPQQIDQVFLNLLINAADAIREGGSIRISTRVEGSFAAVRIRDDGVGIAPEQLDRVFEPFFTTKPVGEGTGLGLHLAYTIVRAHRGQIEFQSKAGRGTEFTVRLPLGD